MTATIWPASPKEAGQTNGEAAKAPPVLNRDRVEGDLLAPMTDGYQPTLPLWALDSSWLPQVYILRDVELMMTHPVCRAGLDYFKSGIAAVEFETECADAGAQDYIQKTCQRFWDRGVPKLQGGYEYGWMGAENMYGEDGGYLFWDSLRQFNPRDCFLLTQEHVPVGVRVKNVRGEKGHADLWLGTKDVPAKGLWYSHEPRYNLHYGTSQYLASWRPWRRLAWKDGAESVVDMAIYRWGVRGIIVEYPNEDTQVASPSGAWPATAADSQGGRRRSARDVARQICEWYKAGAGVGIDSSSYPESQGGGKKWSVSIPDYTLNPDGLLNYVRHLWDQIFYGIGVPPELIQASEGGSGYSGRKIPREAFLMRQQRIADAILHLFVTQVLKPLVRWNFGDVKFSVSVKNILMSERKAQTGQDTESGLQQGTQAPGGMGTQQSQGGGWDQRGLPPTTPTDTKMFSLAVARAQRVNEIAKRIAARAA